MTHLTRYLWYGIWLNYLIWTFDMICYLIHQFDTTSQICFLAMKVTWPCHWCTNGMTLVWLSDVPHRPLLIWYAHFMNCYGYYDWFVGAYGCILDLYLFRGIYHDSHIFGLVTEGVCNTRLSHYLGVATPTLEASPHVTFGIPRSPLRIHYIWFDLVWARSGLLFLKLIFLFLFPNSYIIIHYRFTQLLCYCYLLPIYLFTELS